MGRFRKGKRPGPSGKPLAPPHLNHDFVIVNILGTLGARRTGSQAPSPPPLGALPAEYSRNEPDLAGPAILPPWGSRDLCPFAGSVGLERSSRPSSDRLAKVLQHTWVPSTPGFRTPVSHTLGRLFSGVQAAGPSSVHELGPGAGRKIAVLTGAKLVG